MRTVINNKYFLVIFVIAIILRFWNLGKVPPSPNWDEVALGYNAYSVLKTGKDEYGIKFPITLRSYDDYKPSFYMYATIPFVYLGGLSVWTTRLPSVIFGLLAVVSVYALSNELLKFNIQSEKEKKYISYWVMFLFSISPWHLQFSRMAFESAVALSFIILATVFFFKGLRKNIYLSFSAFFYGLSLYTYHSARVFSPLIILLLFYAFKSEIVALKTKLIPALIVGIFTVLPLIPVFFDSTTLTRLKGTSAIADQTGLLAASVKKLERAQKEKDYIGIVFNNRRVIYARTIIEGYLSHFSLGWLFIRGDNARHHAPDMGLLYIWELPFLVYGGYYLAKRKNRINFIVFGWLLIAPVAASPTTELPHAIRTMTFMPMLQFLVSFGIYGLYQKIKVLPRLIKNSIIILVGMCMLFGFLNYMILYHVHQNIEFSRFWQYGYQDAVNYVKEHGARYSKVIVSTKLEQPYMFFLFFTGYDPVKYLSEGGTASGGFAEKRNRFSNIEFRPIFWNTELKNGRYLYIGAPNEIPSPNIKTIYYLNGEEAIRIAD